MFGIGEEGLLILKASPTQAFLLHGLGGYSGSIQSAAVS